MEEETLVMYFTMPISLMVKGMFTFQGMNNSILILWEMRYLRAVQM